MVFLCVHDCKPLAYGTMQEMQDLKVIADKLLDDVDHPTHVDFRFITENELRQDYISTDYHCKWIDPLIQAYLDKTIEKEVLS